MRGSVKNAVVKQLAAAFKAVGQITPVLLYLLNDGRPPIIISGFHRVEAAILLEWEKIKAVFVSESEMTVAEGLKFVAAENTIHIGTRKADNDYNQFGEDYFQKRNGNDQLRQISFHQEKEYIKKYLGENIFRTGNLLDVGCSTGEFIASIGWNKNNAYGMEISDYARSIAEKRGISFKKDLFNSENYFDLIVFRGTIQYIPDPFEYIKRAYVALKNDGHVLFLATPNTNSLYYQYFHTLPFLEEHLNYLIPCDISLSMNLKNVGFKITDIDYPYLTSPYSRFISDHYRFIKKLLFHANDKFAFWKNSMNVLAKKL
jgi:SAM-dependent methyltransferase